MLSNSSKLRRGIVAAVGLPLWVFGSFMLAQLICVGLIWLAGHLGLPLGQLNAAVYNSIVSVLIYALTITIVIGLPLWLKKQRTTLKDLGLERAPGWLDIVWAPAGFVVYIIGSALLTAAATYLLPFIDQSQLQDTGFSNISSQAELFLAFIVLVVVAPVAEEVLFRGYLLSRLRRYLPVWLAVILTSLLFGLVHFQWNVGLDVFALSLALCWLRIQTGSLWPSILLHSLKNGIAFYVLFINPILNVTMGS